jgi:hypothetical protein
VCFWGVLVIAADRIREEKAQQRSCFEYVLMIMLMAMTMRMMINALLIPSEAAM